MEKNWKIIIKEYDENGNLIYFEDSVMVEYGRKALDKRPNKSSLS